MVDAHCHLYEVRDIGAEVQRAKVAGVTTIICNGASLENSQQSIAIAEKYEGVYATIGMHPEAGFDFPTTEFLKLASHPKVVAIGECGLDYPEDTSEDVKKKQKELLRHNLDLARQVKLPLVIHCRNAFEDVFELVDYDQVQMHCFTGNLEQMQMCVERGWYISIGGIITFKKSEALREVIKLIPNDKLLLETDSPYLSPEPVRGERNQPANVKIIAELVAKLRGVSLVDIDVVTTKNARKLFTKLK